MNVAFLNRVVVLLAFVSVTAVCSSDVARSKPIRDTVATQLTEHGRDVRAAIWIGDAAGRAWFEHEAPAVMPTASAIKTFYLVEFFDAYAGQLDRPLPDAASFLKEDHPAVSHFSPAHRDEIRSELSSASIRRIGDVMMGKTDVSNIVYNAAANLVTAALGGPEQLTARIHRRDPRFESIVVRRYMLRDRTQPGDNEGTADAFAALYQSLVTRKLSGINDALMTTLHDVLNRGEKSGLGRLFEKDGGLSTDPLTSVKAGWADDGKGPVVFVVMCRQPTAEAGKRPADYEALQKLAVNLRNEAVGARRAAH
jgi:hypothetical protein